MDGLLLGSSNYQHRRRRGVPKVLQRVGIVGSCPERGQLRPASTAARGHISEVNRPNQPLTSVRDQEAIGPPFRRPMSRRARQPHCLDEFRAGYGQRQNSGRPGPRAGRAS